MHQLSTTCHGHLDAWVAMATWMACAAGHPVAMECEGTLGEVDTNYYRHHTLAQFCHTISLTLAITDHPNKPRGRHTS